MEKRPGNLDDVAKLLSKKAEQKIILKKRNQSQRILRHKRNKREHNEEGRILVIPVLIVVLILLIKLLEALGFGGGVSNGKNSPASASNLSSSSDLVDVQEEHALKVYNDDVLQKFFQDYFQAKLAADVDTLYRLSGVTNQSTEQRAKLKSQLKTQAGYIESYEDIKTYAVPGIGKNEKLVFVQYKVHFRRAKTLAPAIMYCYIKVNEANSFELVENRTPEQTKFIYAYIQKHQEVKDLINAVDSQLLEALSSDSRLAVLYDAFQTGRIYKEDQASIDSQVSLIEMDENGPTEAKSASETEAYSTGTEGKTESSASESSASAG
nr:hypothetical protein [uncultured Oribacterium sp.]